MSDVLDPIAQKLADIAGSIEYGSDPDEKSVKGIKWPPSAGDTVKRVAAVVELPGIRRTNVHEKEDHLGQDDWRLSYWVVFYFDITRPQDTAAKAADVIEAWIKAIDSNQRLDLLVEEAKVVEAPEPEWLEDKPRSVLIWRTRVEVLQYVNQT